MRRPVQYSHAFPAQNQIGLKRKKNMNAHHLHVAGIDWNGFMQAKQAAVQSERKARKHSKWVRIERPTVSHIFLPGFI